MGTIVNVENALLRIGAKAAGSAYVRNPVIVARLLDELGQVGCQHLFGEAAHDCDAPLVLLMNTIVKVEFSITGSNESVVGIRGILDNGGHDC